MKEKVTGIPPIDEPIDEIELTPLDNQSGEGKECSHHWLIEPPSGPTSHGRCKHCGDERYFINSTADWVSVGEPSDPHREATLKHSIEPEGRTLINEDLETESVYNG